MVSALDLYRLGYTDLLSVIPPGAELAPGSRMQASSLGKAPGRKLPSGKWAGYNWRTHVATPDELAEWTEDGASFGLRADHFPGLDIDVLDAQLASEIEALAHQVLGPAPVRYGRRPKRLLVYRRAPGQPISRMRLWLEKDGVSHLVELLGAGQQYLVAGTHPVTGQPYEWTAPPADTLTVIDRAQVEAFFAEVAEEYGAEWRVYREGDGYSRQNAPTDQTALRAPSIDALQQCVDRIPNTDAAYPGRDSYVRVGYAIRAAAGDAVEEGYEVFASWAQRHPKDERVSGNPVTWREDYHRMRPPYAIGWNWLQNEAQRHGFNTAREDFDAVLPTAPAGVTTPDRLPNGDSVGHFYEEFVEHPEYTEMPSALVPHFAWRGLRTLFAGREKSGKSTLLLAGVVAATKGEDFLGEGTEPPLVVWLTESARPTLYHAMKMGGAAPRRLLIVPMEKEPALQLAHALARWSPDIVVVDTLYRFAAVEDENNASQWRPYLDIFDRVTSRGGAIVVVHHSTKASDDGRYRGSSALGGWADFIIEMARPQPESDTRRLTCTGKYDLDDFEVRYDRATFQFRLMDKNQQEERVQTAREQKILAHMTAGTLKKLNPTGAETAALAVKGLAVKTSKGWRVTTADERAQREMGL